MRIVRSIYRGRALASGAALLGVAVALSTAGCGGSDSGDANYSQKFENPSGRDAPAGGAAPAPKAAPARKSAKDINDLSPRERREQSNPAAK